MYKQFRIDLALGLKFESLAQKQIMEHLENKYKVINTYDTFEYDFQLSNGLFYEVKYERMSLKTNNVFIEFESFNKSSGINKTLADFYIIILPIDDDINNFLLIDVDMIQKLIEEKRYLKIFNSKDKSGYIFNKHIFTRYGLLI